MDKSKTHKMKSGGIISRAFDKFSSLLGRKHEQCNQPQDQSQVPEPQKASWPKRFTRFNNRKHKGRCCGAFGAWVIGSGQTNNKDKR